MMHWKKMLKSLGFTDSEGEVYLLFLEMGPSAVHDVAKRAGVSRMTTYTAIESLTKRGLVSSVNKGRKTLYSAESPERLLSFVQTRVRDMETTLLEVQNTLDELKLKQRGEKPVVKMFEGPEALITIQNDLIESKPHQINEFGNLNIIRKLYPPHERVEFFKNLERINPKNQSILLDDTAKIGTHNNHDRELMILNPEKHKFNGNIFVYGNKIALSTFKSRQISVIIESEELVETLRAFFTVAMSNK